MRYLALLCLLAPALLAQTANVQKRVGTNALTEDFTVPSGRTVTFAVGAAIALPDNALQIADVSALQTTLDAKAGTSTANTFSAAQTAPSFRLPTYAGSATIPADQSGMGWDENGRFTLQSPAGALQLYSVGAPAVPTIYWPGNIVAQSISSTTTTTLLPASNITTGTSGGEALNLNVVDNSLLAPLKEWQGTMGRAVGIPTQTDAQGTGGTLEFVDGTYWAQAVVSGMSGNTSTIAGRYRTAAQARADLGVVTQTVRALSANATLTTADSVVIVTGAGGVTLTLPAANATTPLPLRMEIINRTSGNVVLSRVGADLFEGFTTATISAGSSWSITSDASANWYLN